jgi:hypothetical protein
VKWPLLAALLVAACYPTTTRPSLTPLPEAAVAEWELFVPEAMRTLALALDADSIPVSRTEPDDGWLETPWFDAATLRPTTRRPLGEGVVRLRAWADPARPNHSAVTVEVVYIPAADPSREGRALERQVSVAHPVAQRVALVMARLSKEYGEGSPEP